MFIFLRSKNTTHHASDFSEEELNDVSTASKKHRSPAAAVASTARLSTSKKRRHTTIAPVTPRKYSTYELFGTDSEDEDDDHDEIKSTKNGNSSTHMYSCFTVKYPKAYSRQIHKCKIGTYYIELKLNKNNETKILTKRQLPDIMIKNRTDCNMEAW